MNRFRTGRILVAISIGLLIALSAAAQTKKSPASTGVHGEFKALIDQYYAAWSTLNPNNAAKFYAKDADSGFL
jgi:hypothetical protein